MKQDGQQPDMIVGLLTSPWSILVSIGIAAFVGVMFKDVAGVLRPFGQMYLYMIEMTVIPIIISAVVSSVAGLAKSSGIRTFILRMIVVFALMLVGVALLGIAAGFIGHPGSGLDERARNALGSIVQTRRSLYGPDLELSLGAPLQRGQQTGIVDFLVQMVPRNIFQALSAGRAIELIFFSIVFGIAVGVLGAARGGSLIDIFDGLFKAFQKIVSWLMVALPLGLICMLSDQIASTGFQILLAMLRFILVFYAVGAAVFAADVIIIWRRSRVPLLKVLKALLDPIVISLVTRSSFATLPTAIKKLTQELGYHERSTNLFFSLGTTLGRFGNILYFAVAALFVAQLYGAQLGIAQYGIATIGSIFAGLATAGASGIATLNLLSIALTPLGLPLEAVLVVFIAIDTIADPLRTMLIVVTNMAANTLIVRRVDTLNRRTGKEPRPDERAEEVETDLLTRIAGKRELVAAMEARDAPPFYSVNEDGAVEGLSVDAAKALALKLGVRLKLDRTSAEASEIVMMLRDGEADVALGPCNFHKVFENELRYSEPYVSTREAVLADKNRLNVPLKNGEILSTSLESCGGKVGVVAGSIQEKTAPRLFPKAALESLASPEDLADAVLHGELSAAFSSEMELRAALEKRPARESAASIFGFNSLPADLRFAVAPKHERALPLINGLIESLRETSAPALPP